MFNTPVWRGLAAAALCALLTACGGGGGGDGGTDSAQDSGQGTSGGTATLLSQPANTTGRLLASNCFQCHGTGGQGGFESLRGEADEVQKYRNLASRPARSDIMAAHAQGYTDAQIAAVIRYLQQ
ncbi:cytochrome c [Ideonella sp. 4Y11]|uniref:Cytochrome c n=1 Tax=Ideonella aquatica TaxID=2824119 RepID=A0A940YHY4_9BURK|nr:cytochrome c [Ideonella aquatica]MBQ0960573.1 cytochrome c [Ideonella aquatica]